MMPPRLFAVKPFSRDNGNGPRGAGNTAEGLTNSLDLTKEPAMANRTPRPPFMPSIVEMLPGEEYDRYLWRRRKIWERERAEWLRAGPMGQARDADGNPLYRIDDRARWVRTKPMKKSRHREVLERDGGRCVICGSTKRLEVDHIIRYIDGGSHELDNLRTLCAPCHSRRGGKAEL